MKIKPAKGASGHLIHCVDHYMFRVYDYSVEPPTFIDYNVHHCDLLVTITDVDSAFYSSNGVDYLDHAPGTIGITV